MTGAMQWAGYCALVSAVLALGAIALERAARASGRMTRLCWVSALVLSVAVPFIAYMRPAHVAAANASVAIELIAGPASGVTAAVPGSASIAHLSVLLWAGLSGLVLLFVACSLFRLWRARRTWAPANIDGVDVWLSEDVGPAAFGVVHPDIVVPRWVLTLEEHALALMMLHEREHLRAWDPRLMLASVLIAAVMPWNPVAWFMVRRLRLAIEIDCDARVLSHEPDALRYGAVLLEVGRRRASGTFALSTFAEPRSQLEHRIRRMAERTADTRLTRAVIMCTIALALAGVAYAVQSPLHARTVRIPADAGRIVTGGHGTPTPDAVPRTTSSAAVADTVRPRLRNGADLARLLNRAYPPALRDAGIEGVVALSVFVGESGKPQKQMIATSSGYTLMDAAALTIPPALLFTPAIADGRRTAMWITLKIPFRVDTRAETAVVVTVPRPAVLPAPSIREVPAGTTDAATPFLTPMTVIPRLLNKVEVEASVAVNYPPLLRDAGIGGKTKVWFYIDENGRSIKQMVNTTSGYAALDRAALRIAPVLRFTPAENAGVRVPVWMSIDIVFTPNRMQPEAARNATGAGAVREPGAVREQPRAEPERAAGLGSAPAITPMTLPPKLLNRDDVVAATEAAYPKLLRDAGIGGKTKVWLYINEDGHTGKWLINTPSGHDALDEAALRVAPVFRFTPAENNGKPVGVWVAIDIVFKIS